MHTVKSIGSVSELPFHEMGLKYSHHYSQHLLEMQIKSAGLYESPGL